MNETLYKTSFDMIEVINKKREKIKLLEKQLEETEISLKLQKVTNLEQEILIKELKKNLKFYSENWTEIEEREGFIVKIPNDKLSKDKGNLATKCLEQS